MKKTTKILWMVFLFLLVFAGCSQQTEPIPPTETAAPVIETNTNPPAAQPTDTPQPGLVVLLSPAQGWGDDHATVEQAALSRGLAFEVRQGMTLQEAPQNLQVVVSLGEMPGLEELIPGLPQVQFVVVGGSSQVSSDNLTIIERGGSLPSLAFMAGYIAAVQAEEWRIGIISVADASGQTYRDAFLNGVLYFCGICNPVFPPFEPYPLYAEVVPGGGEVEIQQAADALISRAVDMVHVAPALQSDALYQYLAQRDIRIVGTNTPPADLETNWVASIIPTAQLDLASVLDSSFNGKALGKVEVSLQVIYTGISAARLAHFNEIISKLASGEIDPVGLVE